MNPSISKFQRISISSSGILAILLCWALFSRGVNTLILPSPLETWLALKELFQEGVLFINLWITVRRALIGYGLAIITGLTLAIALNTSKTLQLIFRPLLTIIQTIPPVIWLLLAVIWFGIAEDITPIFLIFIVTFPVIFINIREGLSNLEPSLVEMARVYRCTKKQVILEIYLPALIPHLVSAVTIGLAFAWKSTIFAEFIGSASGVGFALSMAHNNLETAELFAWTLVLIGLMFFFEYLIFKPLQRHVTGWKGYE